MYSRLAAACLLAALAGCASPEPEETPKPRPKPRIEGKRANIGPSVVLETMPDKTRRVIVHARVCLREGSLELLLTREGTATHEAIFAADFDARHLHTALLAAGARNGKPARWMDGKGYPPTGSKLHIEARWTTENGDERTVPATSLVRHRDKGKALDGEWIFGGSQLASPKADKADTQNYRANGGHVVSIENSPDAVVDVSISNPEAAPEERVYEAWTERLPPKDTPVQLIFTLAR